jgi:hypothetical protein
MASPFAGIESDLLRDLYRQGLSAPDITTIKTSPYGKPQVTRQSSLGEYLKQMRNIQMRSRQMEGMMGYRPMTETSSFGDGGFSSMNSPSYPYSSSMMAQNQYRQPSIGSSFGGGPFASSWSSIGQAPRFPYS